MLLLKLKKYSNHIIPLKTVRSRPDLYQEGFFCIVSTFDHHGIIRFF